MDPILGMILFFLLAIVVSFTCSVLEASLLSTPESYINMKIQEGSKSAKLLLKLKKNIDDPISVILTLNTCAHTIGAAGVGAEAEKVFGAEYFAVISAVLTLAILIFSELIPKSIGAHHWKNLVGVTAYTIRGMVIITYPVVYIYRKIMNIFSSKENESTISREEVSAMINMGTQEGVFNVKENKMIQNMIAIEKFKVEDIMTPRTVVKTFDINTTLEEFPDDFEFSRIPIWEGEENNIVGIAYRSNIYQDYDVNYPKQTIRDTDYDSNILFIPGTCSVNKLFEKFLSTKQHLSIVVDEYGTFIGVASFEDVIETILGVEICDESDKVEDMQEYARKKWQERKSKLNSL